MATILKPEQREFRANPGKIDGFRLFSDFSQAKAAVKSQNLNFDIRQLNPGQYSSPYHFHRYAEELFLIVSGSATIRTSDGFEQVGSGDVIFFEMGETGAHQLYNHTTESCVYLDVRSCTGHDICEYPDSDKLLIAPTMEVFSTKAGVEYFAGEENVDEKWAELGFLKK